MRGFFFYRHKEAIKVGDKLVTFDYYDTTITKQLAGHSDLSLATNTLPFYMINFKLDDGNKNFDLLTIKQILSTFQFSN